MNEPKECNNLSSAEQLGKLLEENAITRKVITEKLNQVEGLNWNTHVPMINIVESMMLEHNDPINGKTSKQVAQIYNELFSDISEQIYQIFDQYYQ